jgi:hypothetical protein
VIRRIVDVPKVTDGAPDDPDWHPLQHHFRLSAFGLNAFVAREEGQELVGEHDEAESGQEEVYVVTEGRARFWIDGWEQDVPAGFVVALPDPAVRRRAVALEAGTTVLAIGGPARESFPSTWNASHFENVARADDPPTLEP